MKILQNIKTVNPTFWLILSVLFLSSFTNQDVFDEINKRLKDQYVTYPREKAYIHTPREIYVSGEKIWFNSWLVLANDNSPSNISNLLHVQLINPSQKKVISYKNITLENSMAGGYLEIPEDLREGNYMIQAYTSWMLNFEPDYIFKKEIFIYNNEKTAFEISQPFEKLSLRISPEGGKLVEGLTSKVAFEFKGSYENKAALKGFILNNKEDTVTSFQSNADGVGAFILSPKKNKSYFAVYSANGKTYKEPLTVQEEGNIISVSQTKDWVMVRVMNNKKKEGLYSLAFLSGRSVSFKANGSFDKLPYFIVKVPKNQLPKGLVQIVMIEPEGSIGSQRLFFNHKENTQSELIIDNKEKQRRDDVSVALNLNGLYGETAIYAIATQHISESLLRLKKENLASYLILNSELSEPIPDAGKYINIEEQDAAKTLDYLLMSRSIKAFSVDKLTKDQNIKIAYKNKSAKMINGKVKLKNGEAVPDSAKLSIYYLLKEVSLEAVLPKDGKFSIYAFYGLESKDYMKFTVVDKKLRELEAEVILDKTPEFYPDYTNNNHVKSTLSGDQRKAITQLLTRNKITKEYSFYRDKSKDLQIKERLENYEADYTIKLEEYIEFPTMDDIFRELLPGAMMRKQKDKFSLRIFSYEEDKILKNSPMILIDNIPINDIDFLASIDPNKLEEIIVYTKRKVRSFFGICGFGGVIAIYSKKNTEIPGLNDYNLSVPSEVISENEKVNVPNYAYSKEKLSKIPDFRQPFYQENGIVKAAERKVISFYGTDEIGAYEVLVQGINKEGNIFISDAKFQIVPENDKSK